MLINHHDEQIVWQKTRNLKLCFGTNVRKTQFLERFCPAWILALSSQRHAM